MFASFRDTHIFYARNTEVAFSHMFLKDWDMGSSDPPYPKAAGPLSVYNRQQYYEYLDFAIQNVYTKSFNSSYPSNLSFFNLFYSISA